MNKPDFKHMCYLYMQQLTNFPFIEDDFDSLTEYGLLCKIVEYLDKVIKNENTQNETITALYNAFVELKDYVDNLDLQDEVNNKLEEMAESGELLNLLSNYANLERIYNTFDELYNNETTVKGQHVKCFGMLEINDGNGGEFIIDDVDGIPLANGLFAKPLNNYEENFYNEITFTKERYYDTDCYFTTIPLNDNDNNQIDLYMAHREYKEQTPLKYAQEKLTSLTINGALWIENTDDDSRSGIPCIIGKGEILLNHNFKDDVGVGDNYLYIGIKENRDIVEFKVNETTPEQLLASGCKNVFDCFFKLIDNYFPYDLTYAETIVPDIVNGYHPRQVFCEMQDKSIMILSTDGRDDTSKGLTCEQLQSILIDKGVKNAWNLDGGGSTSTEIKTIKINKNIDNSYKDDREIAYTLNAKKVIKNKNIANVYSYMSKMFHFFNTRYQDEKIRVHNLAGADADELYGKLLIGSGTSMTNTPISYCYFINIPNVIIADNRYTYNYQICLGMTNFKIWTRYMRNGDWSEWILSSNPLSALNLLNYTLTTNAYEKIPIGSISNFDNENIIKNEDNTFSIKDISNKLLYFECRIKGSAGTKYVRLNKNDSNYIMQNTYIPDSTNAYQLILIASLSPSSSSDKYSIEVYGASDDSIENMRCYIK